MKESSAHFNQIPEEQRELANWLDWAQELRRNKDGVVKKIKVPYNAKTKKRTRAKSNDPSTWSTFDEAVAAYRRGGYDGIGFCLSGDLIAVDLDGCVLQDGSVEAWAQQIVDELDSYTERSVNGGIHVMVHGQLPGERREFKFKDREHHGVGFYEAGGPRYIVMTGDRISGNGVIEERTAELLKIHARFFPPEPPKSKAKEKSEKFSDNATLSDEELIKRARKANDRGKFSRLWEGAWEGEYPSQSEADLALCCKLAFWTGKDAARIDTLFRQSGLYRDKWERKDYREDTISKAIDQTHDTWTPKGRVRSPATALIDLDQFEPSFDLLNALTVWQGRIRLSAVERKGPMLIATTTDEIQIVWPTMAELNRFAASQAIISDASNILIPTPPHREIHTQWEQAVHLMLKLSEQNIRLKPAFEEETRDLLRIVWQAAGQPSAKDSSEFIGFIRTVKTTRRNPKWGWEEPAPQPKYSPYSPEMPRKREPEPIPPCVFLFEEVAWVHLPSLRMWASIPAITNTWPQTVNVRNGLILLGFEYQENMSRGYDGDSETVCLWRGPLDVLVD
jgi:hypothetical protein